jgi:CelD/BcsL family acetyltransferase involved in cellulose biosynthesis
LTGKILEISDPRWPGFSGAASGACIFHHPSWSDLMTRSYGFKPFIVAILDAEDNLLAGLPVIETKPRHWTSLPFTDHCAPLAQDAESLRFLTHVVSAAYRDHGLVSLELRWPYPAHPLIHPKDLFVIHNLRLGTDYETVARQIHSMHRRNAKNAQKRGVRIHSGIGKEELKAFYALHLETRQRQGTPIQPWAFFDNLRTQVLEKGLGFILLAYHEKDCLAAAVFLHWGKTLTYKYGASSTTGLSLRPNDLLFSEAIRWGCENGCQTLDFGRTDFENTGLREFKSRWGATETPLTYSFVPAAPDGHESKLISLAQTVIRRSPKLVCRMTGELLYRYFG